MMSARILASSFWIGSRIGVAVALSCAGGLVAKGADVSTGRQRLDALVQPLLDGERVAGLTIGVVQPADAPGALVDAAGILMVGYGHFGPAAAEANSQAGGAEASPNESASKTAAQRVPDADTLFEIGSVTKPLTCLLLADMVERGEVQLDEPVSKLLPAETKVPSRDGREITLADLATHSSGLPRMPNNFAPANPADPYADYSAEKLFEFLGSYKFRRRGPGEESVYSNLGMGLLGEALSRRAKSDYETLFRERIAMPLGMPSTRVKLDAAARERLAPGHDADGLPLANWEFEAIVGAGGIRSSCRDMLNFVRANLYLPAGAQTPGTPKAGLPEISETFRKALVLSQTPRLPVKSPPGEIALGWMVQPDEQTVWHNGQTGGYHSYVAFDRTRGTGVAVLCNSAVGEIDALGQRIMELLAGKQPEPLQLRKPVALDRAQLEAVVGDYELNLGAGRPTPLTVTFARDRLWAQLPLQPRLGIYPESPTEFFYKGVDAQLTVHKDASGAVEKLVLHQNGRDFDAPRAKSKPPAGS